MQMIAEMTRLQTSDPSVKKMNSRLLRSRGHYSEFACYKQVNPTDPKQTIS